MPNFRVTFTVDATTTVDVVAEDQMEAEAKAMLEAHPRVCHRCADILDVGDIQETIEVTEIE